MLPFTILLGLFWTGGLTLAILSTIGVCSLGLIAAFIFAASIALTLGYFHGLSNRTNRRIAHEVEQGNRADRNALEVTLLGSSDARHAEAQTWHDTETATQTTILESIGAHRAEAQSWYDKSAGTQAALLDNADAHRAEARAAS
jgi:ABC-type transport system involved in cytochrome bd biosynthesis fused ATPase/permease subunit